MVAPVLPQAVLLVVVADAAVDLGTRDARPDRRDREILQGEHVAEHALLLVARRTDHHRALELGVVAPDGRGRARDEDVPRLEDDVARERMRKRRVPADLAAVAGNGAREPGALRTVDRADRVEHREGRFVRGPRLDLGLRQADTGVALQQRVCEVPPLAALVEERELRLALHRHLVLDSVGDARRWQPELAESGTAVSEDPWVSVVIGPERIGDAERAQ